MRVVFEIDPATLSTAQQRIISYRIKRVIVNPKVAKSMRIVERLAMKHTPQVRAEIGASPDTPLLLSVCFLFAYPKSMTKKERLQATERKPVVSARYGDLDNRVKAFQDALVNAGWMVDDRQIADLRVQKQYTLGKPRIEVFIGAIETAGYML